MKKLFVLILTITLCISLVPSASAASNDALQAADALHSLGLFRGTGTAADDMPIYELDRAATRFEAVTMLVRLLGKESEALAGMWETPFSDLVGWAAPYVGYAYAHGLTNGTGTTTFEGEAAVTASQYLTFVLRALGYSSNTDFQWDAAWKLSDEIGLTDGRYHAETAGFLRADMAVISRSALFAKTKSSGSTLFDLINKQGFGTAEAVKAQAGSREFVCYAGIDDKLYHLPADGFHIVHFAHGGKTDVYVNVMDIIDLIFLAVPDPDYIHFSEEPSLGNTLEFDRAPEFSVADDKYTTTFKNGFSETSWYEHTSPTISSYCKEFQYAEKKLTVNYSDVEAYDKNEVFYIDNVKCVSDNGSLVCSVDSVLQHFGIDCQMIFECVSDTPNTENNCNFVVNIKH